MLLAAVGWVEQLGSGDHRPAPTPTHLHRTAPRYDARCRARDQGHAGVRCAVDRRDGGY